MTETQELRIRQERRERAERETADQEPTEEATEKHARRAERAAYLKEKLNERADAEQRAAEEDEHRG
jgi:hypothetical protein